MARSSWNNTSSFELCSQALNGGSTVAARKLISYSKRKDLGVFFTSTEMAEKLLANEKLKHNSVIFDPTCGAGDLLVAAAAKLGKKNSLGETLAFWKKAIRGTDLVDSFVEVTKHRLLLLARNIHGSTRSNRYHTAWNKKIIQGDGLNPSFETIKASSHILMNPPFTKMKSPQSCEWVSGSVNSAAVFIDNVMSAANEGTRVLAILPEVLRTGSRYNKWRLWVSSRASKFKVESLGIFDGADVDVFALKLTVGKGKATHQWSDPPKLRGKHRLDDFFTVSVGALVPYRLTNEGVVAPYIHPRNVEPWSKILEIDESRRFSGTLHKAPFVVIRRTSRPGDKHRCVASIVSGRSKIAVENHLVVCKPNSGRIACCERLLKELKSEEVNDFIDNEIRCRHLTVGSIKAIPLKEEY